MYVMKLPADGAIIKTSVQTMGKLGPIGYVLLCLGAALWLYGNFAPHIPSLADWYRNAPTWVDYYLPPIWLADFLPSLPQLGALLMLVGLLPLFWLLRS